jgi:hypothetical protein
MSFCAGLTATGVRRYHHLMTEVTNSQLIGTWRLVSFESRDENKEIRHPLGKNALGQLSYGAEGRMSVILVQPDRPPFALDDMRRGTDIEVRSAFEGFLGYFGTFSVDAAAGTVTHHVQGGHSRTGWEAIRSGSARWRAQDSPCRRRLSFMTVRAAGLFSSGSAACRLARPGETPGLETSSGA